MSDILDQGSLIFASAAVLALSFVLGGSIAGLSFYIPLLVLAVAYIPGILGITGLAGAIIGRAGGAAGGFGSSFQRDYAPLLTCAAAAWTAANLPLLLVVWFVPQFFAIAGGIAYLYFAVLVFFAVRTVFGTGNGAAFAIVCVSWIPLVALYFVCSPLRYLLRWLASPFFLFYIFYYLRGEFGNLGAGLRSRQSFRRNLEAAAVNPHDGEAQYQLGLIYQQRRQFTEAIRRFQNAVAIDSADGRAFPIGPHRARAGAVPGRSHAISNRRQSGRTAQPERGSPGTRRSLHFGAPVRGRAARAGGICGAKTLRSGGSFSLRAGAGRAWKNERSPRGL